MSDPQLSSYKKGKFAELIVAIHLSEFGYNVSFASQGCRYDLLLEIENKIYRVQVKSTESPYEQRYIFNAGQHKTYEKGEFDLIACVALDIKAIAYLPPHYLENKKRVSLRPPGANNSRGRVRNFTIADCTLEKALNEINGTTKFLETL